MKRQGIREAPKNQQKTPYRIILLRTERTMYKYSSSCPTTSIQPTLGYFQKLDRETLSNSLRIRFVKKYFRS